jgi:two-component system response regulator NreC
MSLRILIADDHGVLRAGLRALLNSEPDMEVVGEAADGDEALQLAGALCPDVVLMDINMPGRDGLDATRQLVKLQSDIHVLILTFHEDSSLLQEAIQAGASGYILKRAVQSELVDAIKAIARGDMYIHPAMTRALLVNSALVPDSNPVAIDTLTPREVDVLRLLAQGYTNRQVAEKLTLSVRTVESHRANLMDKLDLHSRVELVRYAAQHDLLETEKH